MFLVEPSPLLDLAVAVNNSLKLTDYNAVND